MNRIPSTRCPKCHRVSYNLGDVENAYCGACHEFYRDMRGVFMAQLLCPNRHCIIGGAFEHYDQFEPLKKDAQEVIKKGLVNPWCGICGSTEIEWEVRITRFKTLAEARPEIMKAQAQQLITAAILSRQPKPN